MAVTNKSFVAGAVIGMGVAGAAAAGAAVGLNWNDRPETQASAELRGGLIKASTAPIF